MPNKPDPVNTDDIVKLYLSGMTAKDVASQLGISLALTYKRLNLAGVQGRGQRTQIPEPQIIQSFRAHGAIKPAARSLGVTDKVVKRVLDKHGVPTRKAKDPIIEIDTDEAMRLYEAGVGIRGIAKKFGCAPRSIGSRLKSRGVHIRNRSEQQAMRMARTTKSERKRLAQKANEAARGREHTLAEKIKRAKTRERRKTHRSSIEVHLERALAAKGLPCTPQKAIGCYNCDIAIDSIAVEVWGGHWHWHGNHLARCEERLRHILDSGFHLLILVITRKRFPLNSGAIDNLVSVINELRANPSSLRQYRVIWGDGEFSISGSADDDQISIEPPFTNARDGGTGRYKTVAR
jgi:hypothetical protein